ncbi:four helix bundle protein [Candidatus Uhrbacteria bacterium]|nr:four helix bundle protein [Candidatus Uhrbacteria bacterium]MBD3284280.1 four helix bundle protein [Candidatus Uhrbacteria bacterium]
MAEVDGVSGCNLSAVEPFPRTEVFGLSAQIKRAVVSIPSNIAEGHRRGTRNDYRNFLRIAYGSVSEVETPVGIVTRLIVVIRDAYFARMDDWKKFLVCVMSGLDVCQNE